MLSLQKNMDSYVWNTNMQIRNKFKFLLFQQAHKQNPKQKSEQAIKEIS